MEARNPSAPRREHSVRWILTAFALLCTTGSAGAAPDFVTHAPLTQVYGDPPGTTMREPDAPREGEPTVVWARVGYSFYWTNAAVYYTTDGSDPQGSKGSPGTPSTIVLAMQFVRNEPASPTNIDWLKATIPASAQVYAAGVRYKVGVWHSGGGIEVFANNTGCADNTCDDPSAPQAVFGYAVKLAWPGRGHPNASPGAGFPNVHFWKEEAVTGNNYINVQIDQNGTLYDIYFPSAGCVQGMGTRNEGYVDGLDTFPPGLPLGYRGQMNVNQAMAGLRVDGVTYWLSNEGGAYSAHTQNYVTDTNVVHSSSRLTTGGNNILVEQYDFCPKGIAFPSGAGGQPVRGICIKRFLLTNQGGASRTVDFYWHADFAVNGGDSYDAMFADAARGAVVGYDNTERLASAAGEYNPTSFPNYTKNVAVYLGASLKLCDAVGSAGGTPATDSWRDSSPDNAAGWVGVRITLAPGQTRELNVAIAGGARPTGSPADTYAEVVAPALDWFLGTSMASVQAATETSWRDWLAQGTTITTPDPAYDALFKRSLLATALHVDAAGGGIIAGMHNGAYPFVWPRDALYAAVTLDRTGHTAEAGEVFRFLRDVAYRANDSWGKGFWYQKYTTDGYQVWTAPQVDETANVPWAGYYHYLATGDLPFLSGNYTMFYEAGRAMSEDSGIDPRLYFDDPNNLMHSNNVWEDAFDDFLYSNATVERGLRDAARIATATGHGADAAMFTARANTIHAGLNGRLDWDGENTDISQIGLVWPFETHSPVDPRMAHVMDRMNGVGVDRYGNNHPLVNFSGEFQDLINRYWGDTYWNGGPWFLSTLWYGQFFAKRQDYAPGKDDIDNFKYRIDRTRAFLGPIGLGAEQIAPSNSLLYPGQPDFRLQAAWPNAWESMSFYLDCLMLFLDHVPDAPNGVIRLAPKLPSGWNSMTYRNIRVGSRAIDITCSESVTANTHAIVNVSGGSLAYDTYVRLPAVNVVTSVKRNGTPVPYTYESAAARVHVTGPLETTTGATTSIVVTFNDVFGDFDHDGYIDGDDLAQFIACATRAEVAQTDPQCSSADRDGDTDVDMDDFAVFQACYRGPDSLSDPGCTH